jgi:predicted component of type VI protein secretion system
MPKPRRHRRARASNPRKPIQPFSLILQPAELETLRNIARKEGTSIGAVVRCAIYTEIAKTESDFGKQVLKSEANAFLDQLAQRYPMSLANRKAFSRLVATAGR